MGFFARLGFGWRLGTTSIGVVTRDKTLMLFPVLSGLAGLALLAAFVLGIGPHHLVEESRQVHNGEPVPPAWYAVAFALYFAVTFIAVYFNVALIGAAQQSIAGKDTTLGDGFAVANQHLGKIVAWSLLSGTVGLLLNLLESNDKIGRIVRALLGTAWGVITYFVVPVMIFENLSPTAAIGRSVSLMKSTWGENAGAQVGIGLLTTVLIALIAIACIAGSMLVPKAAIVLLPLLPVGIVFTCLLLMTAKAVIAVGIYQYATNSGSGGVFKAEELQAAFR